MVKYLPNTHEYLGSIPSMEGRMGKREGRRGGREERREGRRGGKERGTEEERDGGEEREKTR